MLVAVDKAKKGSTVEYGYFMTKLEMINDICNNK